MKILHTVEFYNPSVGGMQEVARQISERLAKFGHDITVATTGLPERKERKISGVTIEEFDISGNDVRGMRGEIDRYREFLLNSNFDIVTNFAAQQWATDIALPLLGRIKAVKVFVPTGFSGLYLPKYREYFEKMKAWMELYDMNVFLSDDYRDINFARENNICNTILIPNGAGEDEFVLMKTTDIRKRLNIPHDHILILHVGSHIGTKGHMEAIEVFERADIKDATFLIVGNYFDIGQRLAGVKAAVYKLAFSILRHNRCPNYCKNAAEKFNASRKRDKDGKRLLIESLPRQETVSAYKEADLFLFPSEIECSPIVLFECMASKTPYLTTDVGNAKEIISWSGSGILLPTRKDAKGNSIADIEDSIKLLEELCDNPSKREEMAQRGFAAWKDRFSWEKIAKDYENLYCRLYNERHGT